MNINLSSTAKYLGGAVITIFLGALGSGLWENLISPFFRYTFTLANSLISYIYSGYYDSVYKAASSGFNDAYMIKISSLIIITTGMFLMYRMSSVASLSMKVGFMKFQMFITGVLILTVGYFMLARADSVQIVESYSHMSMEILRPYVGEPEYRLLKSNYYRITNEKGFLSFNKKLITLSENFNVELPDKYNKAFKRN
jgi:hypothetical protein